MRRRHGGDMDSSKLSDSDLCYNNPVDAHTWHTVHLCLEQSVSSTQGICHYQHEGEKLTDLDAGLVRKVVAAMLSLWPA